MKAGKRFWLWSVVIGFYLFGFFSVLTFIFLVIPTGSKLLHAIENSYDASGKK
ncbi:MAG: hypothetical protein PHQ27_04965 [Victivallales bacterium]|nr:hypothetical protein [Victivallales bacterium]